MRRYRSPGSPLRGCRRIGRDAHAGRVRSLVGWDCHLGEGGSEPGRKDRRVRSFRQRRCWLACNAIPRLLGEAVNDAHARRQNKAGCVSIPSHYLTRTRLRTGPRPQTTHQLPRLPELSLRVRNPSSERQARRYHPHNRPTHSSSWFLSHPIRDLSSPRAIGKDRHSRCRLCVKGHRSRRFPVVVLILLRKTLILWRALGETRLIRL